MWTESIWLKRFVDDEIFKIKCAENFANLFYTL